MARIIRPEDDTPDWEELRWEVSVLTDQYNGKMEWVHFRGFLTGSEAWLNASSLADTFKVHVRIRHEYNGLTFESVED